jgi:hypothetical protein
VEKGIAEEQHVAEAGRQHDRAALRRDRPRPSGGEQASAASPETEQRGGPRISGTCRMLSRRGGSTRREKQHRCKKIQHQPVDFTAQADDGNAALPTRPDTSRGNQQRQGQQRFKQQLLRKIGRHAGSGGWGLITLRDPGAGREKSGFRA